MSESLEQRTQKFWSISSKWNGRSKRKMSTDTALRGLNSITEVTFYKRPLLRRASDLQGSIIRGGSKKKSKVQPAPIARIGKQTNA